MAVAVEGAGFGEQAHEHVMGQVRRILGIAELALEPGADPSVVIEVIQRDLPLVGRGRHRGDTPGL
ncbi:hypothetical protein D3C80_1577750 [compost metagenome]